MNLFDFILLCCRAIGRFFKKIGVLLLQAIRLSVQYCWVVIPFAILGIVGGWFWIKPQLTTYEGGVTIIYAEGMRDIVQDGLFDFLNLPNEQKLEYGLTEEAVEGFRKISIYNIVDCNVDSIADFIDWDREINYTDTLNFVVRDRVHLEIEMFGCNNFKAFEVALFNFFNSQNYLVEANKYCKDIQKQKLDYCTKEVARLDSFSTYDYFLRPRFLGAEWGNHLISEREQNLYYQDLLIMLKKKNYMEMQVLSTPNVINFQTPFVVKAMPPMYKYLIGLCLGLLVGILVALGVKHRKVVVAYLKEK